MASRARLKKWATLGGAVMVVLVSASCVPPTSGPTRVSAPSPAGPHYMTEDMDLSDVTTVNADEATATVTVSTWGCTDTDTCPAGQRLTNGYVWFAAVQLDVGTSANGPVTYGLHGGIAMGGSGAQSQLYADWSGYCPSALGGQALRSGGTACSSASTNPTYKPHNVTGLTEGRPYTLSFKKVPCTVSEVTDVSGPLSGWRMTVTDTTTNAIGDAGTWCLPNASMIAHVSVFSELYEPVACTTDLESVQFANLGYHDASGDHGFAHAIGHYNGNETNLDANCSNTNMWSPRMGTIIDLRMATRGSNGGLQADGSFW